MKYLGKKYKREIAGDSRWTCGRCEVKNCTDGQRYRCLRKDDKKGNVGYYVLKEG